MKKSARNIIQEYLKPWRELEDEVKTLYIENNAQGLLDSNVKHGYECSLFGIRNFRENCFAAHPISDSQ